MHCWQKRSYKSFPDCPIEARLLLRGGENAEGALGEISVSTDNMSGHISFVPEEMARINIRMKYAVPCGINEQHSMVL